MSGGKRAVKRVKKVVRLKRGVWRKSENNAERNFLVLVLSFFFFWKNLTPLISKSSHTYVHNLIISLSYLIRRLFN